MNRIARFACIVLERLTRSSGNPLDDSLRPAVAAGAAFYLVWTDRRDGNAEIYFKRRMESLAGFNRTRPIED